MKKTPVALILGQRRELHRRENDLRSGRPYVAAAGIRKRPDRSGARSANGRSRDPDCDVVIDIALLTFCDSTGLGVFVAEHKRLQANGHKLTIYAPTPSLQRAF